MPTAPKSFKDEWDFNPLRYRFGTAAFAAANIATLTASLIAAPVLFGTNLVPLAICAATACAVQYLYSLSAPDVERLVRANTAPLSPETAAHAANILNRAGLNADDISLLELDYHTTIKQENDKLGRKRHNNVVTYTKDMLGGEKDILVFGKGAIDALTASELKAIIAHETGHLINRNNVPYKHIQTTLGNTLLFLGVSSLITLSFGTAAFAGAAYIASNLFEGGRKRQDELRADYNGFGLYPADEAFSSALFKLSMLSRQNGLNKPRRTPVSRHFKKAANILFSTHPSRPSRTKHSLIQIPRAQLFYKEKGLTFTA